MPKFENLLFEGTAQEALSLYKKMKAKGLTPEEDFVLRRYLDLNIPSEMERFFWDIDDAKHRQLIKKLTEKITEVTRQESGSAD